MIGRNKNSKHPQSKTPPHARRTTRNKPAGDAVDNGSPQLPPQHADRPVDGRHPAERLGQLADAVKRRNKRRFSKTAEGGKVPVDPRTFRQWAASTIVRFETARERMFRVQRQVGGRTGKPMEFAIKGSASCLVCCVQLLLFVAAREHGATRKRSLAAQ